MTNDKSRSQQCVEHDLSWKAVLNSERDLSRDTLCDLERDFSREAVRDSERDFSHDSLCDHEWDCSSVLCNNVLLFSSVLNAIYHGKLFLTVNGIYHVTACVILNRIVAVCCVTMSCCVAVCCSVAVCCCDPPPFFSNPSLDGTLPPR